MVGILKGFIRNIVLPVGISAILVAIGYYWLNGFALPNFPKIQEVEYVQISDSRLGIDDIKFTERDDVENILNITNFLRYELGNVVNEDYIIKIAYHMQDGRTLFISSGENTVNWNGKSYKIKGENGKDFISVIENIFFYDVGLDK